MDMRLNKNGLTIYELVGGEETFQKLVNAFYMRVEADQLLRPLFPQDLTAGKRAQFLFLVQFFGGPQHYVLERGHPRLRMRHSLFAIDRTVQQAWLNHMLDSLDEIGIQEPMLSFMRDYFVRASEHMINQYDVIVEEDGDRSIST